jgi:hypothetical protein
MCIETVNKEGGQGLLHEVSSHLEKASANEIRALRAIHDYLEGVSGGLMTPTLQHLMRRAQNASNAFDDVKGKIKNAPGILVRYEIRQQVGTVTKKWLELVHKGEFERPSLIEYERLTKEYPNEYFEFVRVSAEEVCLAFTPKFD